MSHATRFDFFATAIALTATLVAVTASSNWQLTGSIEPSFEVASLNTAPQPTISSASAPSFLSRFKSAASPNKQPIVEQAAVYAWIKPARAEVAPPSSAHELSSPSPAEMKQTLTYLNQLKTCTPSQSQHMSVEQKIVGWQGNTCTVETRFAAIANDGDMTHQIRTCRFSQTDINQLTAADVVNTVQLGEMTELYNLSRDLQAITKSSCTTTNEDQAYAAVNFIAPN